MFKVDASGIGLPKPAPVGKPLFDLSQVQCSDV